MINDNIFNFSTDRKEIIETFERLKFWGETTVLTNGCFDVLHVGHINLINNSKMLGDNLIVAINSDRSVRELKGESRPIVNEDDRSFILSNLKAVDYVIIYDEDTPNELLKILKPDYLAKGGEYTIDQLKHVGGDIVTSYGGKVVTMPMSHGRSTTNIARKINELD